MTSDDFSFELPADSVSVSAELAERMGELFDREHVLPPPPKPLTDFDSELISRFMTNECFNIDKSEVYKREPKPEPTLDEKIVTTERIIDVRKSGERNKHKNSRSRLNFGTQFHIAVEFRFLGPKYLGKTDPQDIETTTTNRANLYQHLQYLGMGVVDDTGRDSYRGERTTQDTGYLMLPREIDHKDYFEFEDEVRKRYPFDTKEIELIRLLQQKAGEPISNVDKFTSDPKQMREFIDQLSMDERFSHLFAVAEQIAKARKEKPRATLNDPKVNTTQVVNDQDDNPHDLFAGNIPFKKPARLTEYKLPEIKKLDLNLKLDPKKIQEVLSKLDPDIFKNS